MRTSIVVAAHNEGELLLRTVESCIETADGLDYEIIIADDASTDGAPQEAANRFAPVRVYSEERQRGPSPTKDLGARQARGDVLIFADGHCKPEPGSLQQLVRDIEETDGRAVITPSIAMLDVRRWQNIMTQVGHGYAFDLMSMDTKWLPVSELRQSPVGRGEFYESPALIGCAFAVPRDLYERIWGFDSHMNFWGIEDLDFSIKCWLMGYSILHDPGIVIGHRFQEEFTSYSVREENILVNKLRMAYKNYTYRVWQEWLTANRQQHAGELDEHPEGLWAHAWELFRLGQDSAAQERSYLHGHRTRDEFWYAERFALGWPQLKLGEFGEPLRAAAGVTASPSPSPSPRPSGSPAPCRFTITGPANVPSLASYQYQLALGGQSATAISWSLDKASAHFQGATNGTTVTVAFSNGTADWITLRADFTVQGKRECAEKRIALVKVSLGTPAFTTPGKCLVPPPGSTATFLVNPPAVGAPTWITTHNPGSACAAFTYNGTNQPAESAQRISSSVGGAGSDPGFKAVAAVTLTAPPQSPSAIQNIQVGMIQSGQHSGSSTYATTPPGKQRVITLPATANIDWLVQPCSPGPTDEWPWYDQSVRSQPGAGDLNSWTRTFTLTDSPGAALPTEYNPNSISDPNRTKPLQTATDHDDFQVHIGVRTRNTDLGADQHYFDLGHQTWSVNFSWPAVAGTPIVTTGPNSWIVPAAPSEINCNVVPSITLNVAPFRRFIPS
jgi:glycosyltransferase involved in cell wall biosynthesis